MNKAGIAAGTLMLLTAVGVAGSWYTGTRLETVLQDSISQANAQLAAQYPDSGLALELISFERGLLASQARYQLTLPGELDEPPVELVIRDRIEHGPMPVSRLTSLRWMPVMAVSHAELERSAALDALFTASRERAPLTMTSSIGYGQGIEGAIHIAPMSGSEEGTQFTFSGLHADFTTDTRGSKLTLSGRVDALKLEGDADIDLVGGEFRLDRRREGTYGLYLGDGRLTLDSLAVEIADGPALVLQDMVQSDSTTLGADGVKGALSYQIGSVSYDGRPLGSLRMDWSLSRLDPAATAVLAGLYNSLSLGIEPSAGPAQRSQFTEALQTLLGHQPRLALDNLSIRTANGESRLKLGVDLSQPASLDLPPEVLARQMISGVDANLSLSKLMLSDMVRYRGLLDPQADAAAVERDAVMLAEMAGGMAEMMQLGKIDGDNILSNLRYADGLIDLNGQSIPLDDFIGMLVMLSPDAGLGSAE